MSAWKITFLIPLTSYFLFMKVAADLDLIESFFFFFRVGEFSLVSCERLELRFSYEVESSSTMFPTSFCLRAV